MFGMLCAVVGHRRNDEKTWDGTLYHSHCARCGTELVRFSGEIWRTPTLSERKGFEQSVVSAATPARD